MSDENEGKNEIQSKLMDDNNERDKSYGTEGIVTLPTGGQPSTNGQDEEAGGMDSKNRIKRDQKSRSVIKRMRSYEAKGSHLGFLNTLVSFIFDTICGIIALLIANITQVICIVIGSVYIKDCPNAPGIPIILIVNGAINVLVCILEAIKRRINRNSNVMKNLNIVITSINIASFISFMSWIYIIYESQYPTYDETDAQHYCNKTLYLFAFWLLNVYLILFAILLFITCFCCCFAVRQIAEQQDSA